ncbi:RNA polymerase sigma factor [Aquibium sp. LZ166]|uniref:RNA polymerase sigma factor n=1 Tax=Aquibium pacificus TaxID=3153579 RepID=A0ABV3SR30_9HYPH
MPQPPESDWIEARLVGARPQAVAALLRYFRDLDLAEEAFQEACLRALKSWPKNGPPRDAASWLIMVGRNVAIDHKRRHARLTELPDEELISDREDTEPDMAERLDAADYRDDILRLLFVCCQPELPATQQIALALRIVSGLPVSRIAAAFLVADRAMEQRITRAKARIAKTDIPFETPGPIERAERFAVVAAMIYLIFNEGYTDANPTSERAKLCDEATRLARLMLRLFPAEPEMMGLLALMLLQHSRQKARFDETGAPILLDDQDRTLWNHRQIAEALAMIDKAMRHRQPGPYQIQAAIAALHARAERPEETDWAGIDELYQALERHAPSPVITLNRSVAIWKLQGAEAALEMIAPLAEPLDGYFYFHGVRGNLLEQLGRNGEARDAFGRAIALANTPAEAMHIRQHLDQLNADCANGAS